MHMFAVFILDQPGKKLVDLDQIATLVKLIFTMNLTVPWPDRPFSYPGIIGVLPSRA